MIIFNRRAILAAVLAIVAGGVPASAQDKVGVITDAGFLGRHAYYFVAIEKGYYKEAKLDVNVLRGQGSAEAIKQVGAGNVTFGFADAGSAVLARGNDNVPVRLVAVVYAKPPMPSTPSRARVSENRKTSKAVNRQSRRGCNSENVPGLRQGSGHRRKQGQMGGSLQRIATRPACARTRRCDRPIHGR